MMLGKRLSTKQLAEWSRTLSASLRSGIPILQTLRNASERGSPQMREASAALLASLKEGKDVGGAVAAQSAYFPALFVNMTRVGVETGHLPEVLKDLEKYYRLQLSLRQKLIQQITWPVFQLVMAIFVIALVIYLVGMLGGMDILGLGLVGSTGAVIWLVGWGVLIVAGGTFYWLARNKFGQALLIDTIILRIPVLGPLVRTLALSRTALALHLTLDSGMSLKKAIPLSLAASDNEYIASLAKPISQDVRQGEGLTEAFRVHSIFPPEMIDVLSNAEESGQVPEAMQHYSKELADRAEHQLQLLNQALGWLVWLVVAGIIVFFILRIALVAYVRPIYDTLDSMPGGRG